jgi:hypothetical protein
MNRRGIDGSEYGDMLDGNTAQQVFMTIPNREQFEFNLAFEVQRARRYKHFLTVVVARIGSPVTSMKQAAEGDCNGEDDAGKLLKRVHQQLRSTDMVGNLGETCIGIILVETSMEGAEPVGERLSEVLNGRKELGLGMAFFPEDGCTSLELMGVADTRIQSRLS